MWDSVDETEGIAMYNYRAQCAQKQCIFIYKVSLRTCYCVIPVTTVASVNGRDACLSSG